MGRRRGGGAQVDLFAHKEFLLGSAKIAVDETRAPVLDPLVSIGYAMQSAVKIIGGKGVIIGACNVALMVQSKMLSGNAGVSADAAAKEWAANIIARVTCEFQGW